MGYSCQSVHATNHNMTREDEQGLEGRFGGLLGLKWSSHLAGSGWEPLNSATILQV